MKRYYMLITYPHSGQQHLATADSKAISAVEDTKDLLITMGDRLLAEHVISSYQLVGTEAEEVCDLMRVNSVWDKMDIEQGDRQ